MIKIKIHPLRSTCLLYPPPHNQIFKLEGTDPSQYNTYYVLVRVRNPFTNSFIHSFRCVLCRYSHFILLIFSISDHSHWGWRINSVFVKTHLREIFNDFAIYPLQTLFLSFSNPFPLPRIPPLHITKYRSTFDDKIKRYGQSARSFQTFAADETMNGKRERILWRSSSPTTVRPFAYHPPTTL